MKAKPKIAIKDKLKKQVWEKLSYRRGSREEIRKVFFGNPALVKLLEYSHQPNSILDCGCGDGRIIEILWRKEAKFWGIDLSERAIRSGKKRLRGKKNIILQVGDIEKINFPNETFDLVYTPYTLEHIDKPEKVIEEMIRVVKKGGYLIFVCPNYGSPFHPSPSSPSPGETLTSRALKVFLKSNLYLFKKPKNLDWARVEPKALKEKKWQSDWDTVVEPNIQTLLHFLKGKGVEILDSSSGLNWVTQTVEKAKKNFSASISLRQKFLGLTRCVFEFLGKKDISPYKYFGPVLFVVGKKQ